MSKNKIAFYTFIGLLASSVMAPKFLPLFMFLLVLIWLWEGGFKKKFIALKKQAYLMLLPALFLAFAIGLLYSQNMAYGLQKMETRLSLLLLPVVLPTMISLNFSYNRRVFSRWFVHAATLLAAFCVLRATGIYVYEVFILQKARILEVDMSSNYFYYSELSKGIMHPGYLAMYVNTAIIMCLYDIRRSMTKGAKFRRAIQAFFLAIFVVLLYSKAGIAAMLLILIAFGIRAAILMKKWWIIPLSFGFVGLLLLGIYFFVPNTKTRLEFILEAQRDMKHNPASTESTQARIHAWKASRELIAEKPFFGHGTGDAMDVLYKKYEERAYTGVLSKEMNAHNEYYQTGIAIGFMGITLLILILLGAIYVSIRRKNFALGIWTLCAFFVIYFEAYLNTQAGVVFFALFLPFLTLFKNEDAA
jgi:O-antigen ligase